MPSRCNRGFYCRSYCLLNTFRAPLCPSSRAHEYYTVVAACGISCYDFKVVGLVCCWGLCVRFAAPHQTSNLKTTARNTAGSNHCIILLSSCWWAQWCPKHAEQAIRSAIKTSVASSWHFISTVSTVSYVSRLNMSLLVPFMTKGSGSLASLPVIQTDRHTICFRNIHWHVSWTFSSPLLTHTWCQQTQVGIIISETAFRDASLLATIFRN